MKRLIGSVYGAMKRILALILANSVFKLFENRDTTGLVHLEHRLRQRKSIYIYMISKLNILYYRYLDTKKFQQALSLHEKEFYVSLQFYMALGYPCDLKNPRTFNEKIQWIKLYEHDPEKTLCADKYLVRDWVKERIGEKYLPKLYGVWDRFEDIDFATLPEQFVLKATHGCGFNIIVTDKSKLDLADAAEKFHEWLKTRLSIFAFEQHYDGIQPRIIAEEYLCNADGDLYDYKFFCFHGKIAYVMFLSERATGLKMAFYDMDWSKQEFVYSYPLCEKDVPKPRCLEEAAHLAEKLAADFQHVRADFYFLDDGSIKFGEMTFTSLGGYCKWDPAKWDEKLGNLFSIK